MLSNLSREIQDHLIEQKEEVVNFLMDLTKIESPSLAAETQLPVQEFLRKPLENLGFQVELKEGQKTGGHLLSFF